MSAWSTWKQERIALVPNPAAGNTWRYVTFNAFIDGTRRVFVADMKELLSYNTGGTASTPSAVGV